MVTTTAVAALSAVVLGGWFGERVEGNGKIKEEARKVEAFTGVAIGGDVEAEVRVGAEQKVVLTTDENLLPLFTTTVEGGVLKVSTRQNVRATKGVKLLVVTPRLEQVEASGGSTLRAHAAPSKQFTVEGSGGAKIHVGGVDAEKVVVDLSGGVEAQLKGRAKTAQFDMSGGVKLDATELSVDDADLDASGGVTARIAVAKALTGDTSGGVSVKVKGRPSMKVETSGAASVQSEE